MIDVMYLFSDFFKMICAWPLFKRGAGVVAMTVLCIAPAQAGDPSRVRLLPGGAGQDIVWAGIDIQLAPAWKTYWKTPGQGGLPPRFDWSQSVNIRNITVQWPVPQHFTEGNHSFFGYKNRVVLPVAVTLINPREKARLNLTMHYAVCETLCVPKTAFLSLELNASEHPVSAFEAATVDGFRARVPKSLGQNSQLEPDSAISKAMRAGDTLSIASIEPALWENKPALKVKLTAPEGARKIELFAHDPDGKLGVPVAISAQRREFMIPCSPAGCGGAHSTLVVQVDDEAVEMKVHSMEPGHR
jgi:hypothetical protein